MSTINEKEIVLEEALRVRMIAEVEVEDLKRANSHAHTQLQSLAAEVDSLRNQVNFGTSILLNDQSITRSEPIINEQANEGHNKDIEIEHLRVEVEKGRAREEELVWNIRDLEMQLETVTESLNMLNGSSMNSFLNGSGKLSE
jgi:cell division protein FtsB